MEHQAEAYGICPQRGRGGRRRAKTRRFPGTGRQVRPGPQGRGVRQPTTSQPARFQRGRRWSTLVRATCNSPNCTRWWMSTVVVTPAEVRTRYEQVRTRRRDTPASSGSRTATSRRAQGPDGGRHQEVPTTRKKEQYQQPERRKVQVRAFGLDDEQKKLTGKERMDALTPAARPGRELPRKTATTPRARKTSPPSAKDRTCPSRKPRVRERRRRVGAEEAAIPAFADRRLSN